MAYQYALYEKKNHIAYITINRPEVRNALHPPANWELAEIWDDFANDPDAWVAILTGAGEHAFSAGNDLKYTAERGLGGGGEGERPMMSPSGFGGITSRFDLWKPTIAAVNGFAVGGGLEMALSLDIIIAAEHAQLGLPEPKRGLIAGAGGIHRLPRAIPRKIAMGMILTGKHITAQEAYRYGLVNEVVPLADLIPTAERWANEIIECSPVAVRASKQGAVMGLEMPLQDAMRAQFDQMEAWRDSDDIREGPRAFAEKRKPNWSGR
ncbi:MAG TPA: enoyl-CoA hydratase-related protein [Dehalococcoidia bacterium]|nr:enoyl-CoA hydratase-related protein [Dehalococcoidia bacterium]